MKIFLKTTAAALLMLPYLLSMLPADFEKSSINSYDYYYDTGKVKRLNSKNVDKYSIFMLLERSKISSQSGIEKYMLMIDVVPVGSEAAYLTFPDGGNMLIIFGTRIDTKGLESYLDAKLTKSSKEAGFMKLIGWKPRVDWIVLTENIDPSSLEVKDIIKKYNVKEILSPEGTVFDKSPAVMYSALEVDKKIDVMQTIAPVTVLPVGLGKSKEDKAGIMLKYHAFSFLFLPSFRQDELNFYLNKYQGDFKKVTAVYANQILPDIKQVIDPAFIIPYSSKIALKSEGQVIYVSEIQD